jgi:hypothetical protein
MFEAVKSSWYFRKEYSYYRLCVILYHTVLLLYLLTHFVSRSYFRQNGNWLLDGFSSFVYTLLSGMNMFFICVFWLGWFVFSVNNLGMKNVTPQSTTTVSVDDQTLSNEESGLKKTMMPAYLTFIEVIHWYHKLLAFSVLFGLYVYILTMVFSSIGIEL